ncbi:predicted protein [Postia placenta Mad-698-R]|nr:predicted protein [Postia placenta Mad-698-R]
MWHGGGAKRLGYENRPFVPSHSWMGQLIYKHAAVTVLQLTNPAHRSVLTSTTVRPFVSVQESLPCPNINNKMSLTTGSPRYFYKTESGVALPLETPQDFALFLQDIPQNGGPYLRVLRLSDLVCEMLTRQDHHQWLVNFANVLSGASNLQELRLGHSQNLLLAPSSLSTSIRNCRSLKVLELHAGGPLTIAMLPKMTGQLVHVVHQVDSMDEHYDYSQFFRCAAMQNLKILALDCFEHSDHPFRIGGWRCHSLESLTLRYSYAPVDYLVKANPHLRDLTLTEVQSCDAFSGNWPFLHRLSIDPIGLDQFAIASGVFHLDLMRCDAAEQDDDIRETDLIPQAVKNTGPTELSLSTSFKVRQQLWRQLVASMSSVRSLEICFEAVMASESECQDMKTWMNEVLPLLLGSQVETLTIKVHTWARNTWVYTPDGPLRISPEVGDEVFTPFRDLCMVLGPQLGNIIFEFGHLGKLQTLSVEVHEGDQLGVSTSKAAFVQKWQVSWSEYNQCQLWAVSP